MLQGGGGEIVCGSQGGASLRMQLIRGFAVGDGSEDDESVALLMEA